MGLATPKNYNTIWQTNLTATPNTTNAGTRTTASATPHAKGSWSTIMTATYDSYGFWLMCQGTATSATRTDSMIDIGFGTSGSPENIILPEWLTGWRGTPNLSPQVTYFPIFIPKGAIVQIRSQALIASDTIDVNMWLCGGVSGMMGPIFAGCDAYGTAIASSIGTSHTPGSTGTESTAANIGGTMSKNYGAVMLGLGGTLATTTQTNIAYHWELVIGTFTVCEWYSQAHTTEVNSGPFPPVPYYVSVASGTQLQVRAEGSGTPALAQDIAFYCFY